MIQNKGWSKDMLVENWHQRDPNWNSSYLYRINFEILPYIILL